MEESVADLVVKPDGTVTWGAAQAVQPFGNILQGSRNYRRPNL